MPEIKIELHAEKGMLIVTDDYVKMYSDNDQKWTVLYKQDLDKGVFFDLGGPEYSLEDEHMIQAIQQGTGTDIDIIEGFKVQKAVEGIYRSAQDNSTVLGDEL
jgi:predicted dehydrogenase